MSFVAVATVMVRLPAGTSPEVVSATYRDGVLEIRMPRPSAEAARGVSRFNAAEARRGTLVLADESLLRPVWRAGGAGTVGSSLVEGDRDC